MTEQEHNNGQWKKVKLGDCLKQKPDYGINAPAVPYDNNLPTYLRITDITEDGCYSKKDIVSVANQAALKYVLEEGDLVFARTGASVGKTYLYDSKDGMLVFAGFLIRVKTDENVLLPEFFKYQTHTPQYKNWIAANSMRTGQPGINGNEYEEFTFSIPFKNNKPDLSAQRRIAAILASADKVIAATQKTIAKYKQIKQGMMEDLLKPKEGWKMVKLGEVYNFQYGDGNKNPNNNGDYPIYGANGIIGGYTKFNAVASVVIGHMGEYAGSVIWANGKHFVTYNGTITTVKDNDSLYDRFGFFVLLNLDIKKICAGSGQPFLSYDTLNKIGISVPDLAEQHRIAAILSGIDAKIAAEEKVLDKYEKVKKGLMERLLNEQTTMEN